MEISQQLRSFFSIAVQLLLFLGVTFAQNNSGARASLRSESATTMLQAATQSTLPFCPMQEKGPVPRSETEAGTAPQPQPGGPHKVTLSWNASVASPNHKCGDWILLVSKQTDRWNEAESDLWQTRADQSFLRSWHRLRGQIRAKRCDLSLHRHRRELELGPQRAFE